MSTVIEKKNLNNLSLAERKQLTKQTYLEKSYFFELFNSDDVEVDCTFFSTALRHEIERLLLQKKIIQDKIPLEKLQEALSEEMRAYNFDDGVNKLSTYFYETDTQFFTVYYEFIKYLRQHIFKEPFWFQATPTIRFHCPNSRNSHHYPRFHSDISYGHPPEEINVWIPLTELLTGHGFKILSVVDSDQLLKNFNYDFSSFIHSAIYDQKLSFTCDKLSREVCTPFGKMLAFDSRCIHSGYPLQQHTRVSIDIRILPLSQYQHMKIEYQGSGRRKILFSPGHCYHAQDSDSFL